MQPSQLWRPGIVRPHSPDDWTNGVDEHTPVDYLPVEDDLFSVLWDSGFFRELNSTCGCIIDDHEEEEISGDALVKAVAVVNQFQERKDSFVVDGFLDQLTPLLHRAIETSTPLVFVF